MSTDFKIVDGLPKKSAYKTTQYSTIKRRRGKESIPFLGLPEGEHHVVFAGKHKRINCIVKVWLSPFGWAWKIVKICK